MTPYPLTGEPEYLEARGLASALQGLADAWRNIWTPRSPPDIVEWCEGGAIVLPASVGSGGRGGRLSFAQRPYWRTVLRWVADGETQEIVVVVGSQCGKTLLGIAIDAYWGYWFPSPILNLHPSDEHAEDYVRDRLRPVFQASPFAEGLRSADLRLGGVSFASGASLNVFGVGSPNALKGRPAGLVDFDEYDESLRYSKAAGSPFERAKTRTRSYGKRGKIVAKSTPTTDDTGIWELHSDPDCQQWEWFAKCPHCGAYQKIELGNIKWPRSESGETSESPKTILAKNLAWYECESNKCRWNDADKIKAVADGIEVCKTPERPGIRKSMHIPAWYSPDVSLSSVAAQFLISLGDPEAAKQFRNEWMAEPRTEIIRSGSTEQAHLVTKCVADYHQPAPDWWRSDDPPAAPDWVREVTWGFDVQGSEVWGVAVGWGARGERQILWAGNFVKSHGTADSDIEDACFAFRRPWLVGGIPRKPIRGMMDSGYRTHSVYRATAKTPGLYPSKGRVDMRDPMAISAVDRLDANKRTIQGRVELIMLHTTYWQDQLAAALEADPGRQAGAMHLPANPPAELLRHLTAERKKQVKSRDGTLRYQWVAHDVNNHLRDCLVYATAAAGHAKCLDLQARKAAAPPPAPVSVPDAPAAPAPVATPPAARLSPLARMAAARGATQPIRTTRL